MAAKSALTEWALYLAAMGWRVFPLNPGTKIPALHHAKNCPGTGPCDAGHLGWEHRATTDPDRIAATWERAPFNIGVATGPSGLVVVDCDVLKPGDQIPDQWRVMGIGCGAGVLRNLAQRHGDTVTPTYAVRTPSGGWHLYYRHPGTDDAGGLRSTAGTIGWKVDTRAHGGYVVGPGSIIGDRGYELVDEHDPAELPGWLHQALTAKPSPANSGRAETAAVRRSAYVTAAVTRECEAVRHAPLGERNHILCRASYALGQLVGAGVLDEHTARTELESAWHTWADPASAAKDLGPGGVIDTSLTAGRNNPRRIRPEGTAA
ncbi:bifunctional DNA primase/polymerase [Amycolatopsis nigrescens]|uniref:bifunctional DNA primase/polymerase n=1 Tax=Amycolatopsis nigrescens TaxID=381445 RepID=UPI00037E6EE7|nr:bifunctional DNA primase/polymerase [Amycolatopsis nigrescens]